MQNRGKKFCKKKKFEHEKNTKMEKGSVQFSSIFQQCLTLCDPMDCNMAGLPVHHQFPEPAPTHVHQVSIPSNHLILCQPLFLLPSIFLSSRVFSSESVHHIRWPKYQSFSFSDSASNEYSGLISFRMDRLNLLVVQELSRVSYNITVQKSQFFSVQLSLQSDSHIQT